MPQLAKLGRLAKKNWILLLIIIFYLLTVFYNFTAQGLVNWDESYFAVVVRTFDQIIKTAFTHPLALFQANFFSELRNNYGNVYTVAKPSYLIAASILGLIWPSQLALRLLSVLSGFGVLLIFYRLTGHYQLDKKIRLAATFLLAASPLFLLYSRLGLAPMFSAFFLLVALEQLLRFEKFSRLKNLVVSGFASAILLLSHYSTFIIVGIILLFGLFYLYRKKSGAKNYFIYLVSFLSLPLVWQIISGSDAYLASRLGIFSTHGRFGAWSYAQEFFNQLKINGNGADSFSFSQPGYYFQLIWSMEGLIFFLLLLLGAAFFLRNARKPEYQLIVASGGIFLLTLIAAWEKYPRTVMPIFPLGYLLAGVALAWLGRKFFLLGQGVFWQKIFIAVICLAIFLSHLSYYPRIIFLQTPFADMAAFIQKNYAADKTLLLTANAPLWRIYLPGYAVEQIDSRADWEKIAPGKTILVTDDYFNWTVKANDSSLNYSSRKILQAGQDNVFALRPVIEDLVYMDRAKMDQLISDNLDRKDILYEVTLLQ
ncbi:MAG TPA: glycosyltransferase family 39 protein [Candidatus Methylomirabilis sp.]|nr:glycosyltransferase family 39 protein [Candidatus Methylomirabilis sp.]